MLLPKAAITELVRWGVATVPPETLARLGVAAKSSRVIPGLLAVGGGFAAGLCVGWLTAPRSGAELRAMLLERVGELAGKVLEGEPEQTPTKPDETDRRPRAEIIP